MVVAHQIIDVQEEDLSLPDHLNRNDLPALTDGHQYWASGEIKNYLEKLHQDLKLSRSMQSDACYLDPDNPEKCL